VSQGVPVVTQRRVVFHLLQDLIRLLLKLLTRYRVVGAERYPADGPYITVFNHLHWMDTVVVFPTLRHEVAAVVAEKWARHPLVGFVGRQLGHAIAVETGKVDPRSLADALKWLNGGGVLLIAPEGRRSPRGLARAMRGTAFLAARTGAPIVPVAAWGQEGTFTHLRRLRRPRLEVHIGQPFRLPGTPNHARGAELDAYTDDIMAAIAGLLPEGYRGSYQTSSGAPEAVPDD